MTPEQEKQLQDATAVSNERSGLILAGIELLAAAVVYWPVTLGVIVVAGLSLFAVCKR